MNEICLCQEARLLALAAATTGLNPRSFKAVKALVSPSDPCVSSMLACMLSGWTVRVLVEMIVRARVRVVTVIGACQSTHGVRVTSESEGKIRYSKKNEYIYNL